MFHFNICIIHMHFRHYSLRIKISFQNLISIIIETCFDKKKFHGTFSRVPWNLLNNIWTTPVVPWNSMELEQQNLKYHGIPWNFVQIQSFIEFRGTYSILPSFMELHGIPWNFLIFPPKSSMEFHGTFLKFHGIPSWNSMELDKFHI